MNESKDILVSVILGSVRPGNYTAKAARLVVQELEDLGARTEWIDPARLQLPQPGLDTGSPDAAQLRSLVTRATGVILATPEYHGAYSSVIKLVIENLGFPSVLDAKPVGLLGVAAGQIGAIKSLESLRSVCSHVGAIVLPAPVSVANVRQVFDEEGRCLEPTVEQRLRGLARNLMDYVHLNICPRITLEAMVRETTPV